MGCGDLEANTRDGRVSQLERIGAGFSWRLPRVCFSKNYRRSTLTLPGVGVAFGVPVGPAGRDVAVAFATVRAGSPADAPSPSVPEN